MMEHGATNQLPRWGRFENTLWGVLMRRTTTLRSPSKNQPNKPSDPIICPIGATGW